MAGDLELLDEEFYEDAEKLIPRQELLSIKDSCGDSF